MKYSVEIPNSGKMNLAMIKGPVEAYEAMTQVARGSRNIVELGDGLVTGLPARANVDAFYQALTDL